MLFRSSVTAMIIIMNTVKNVTVMIIIMNTMKSVTAMIIIMNTMKSVTAMIIIMNTAKSVTAMIIIMNTAKSATVMNTVTIITTTQTKYLLQLVLKQSKNIPLMRSNRFLNPLRMKKPTVSFSAQKVLFLQKTVGFTLTMYLKNRMYARAQQKRPEKFA